MILSENRYPLFWSMLSLKRRLKAGRLPARTGGGIGEKGDEGRGALAINSLAMNRRRVRIGVVQFARQRADHFEPFHRQRLADESRADFGKLAGDLGRDIEAAFAQHRLGVDRV